MTVLTLHPLRRPLLPRMASPLAPAPRAATPIPSTTGATRATQE